MEAADAAATATPAICRICPAHCPILVTVEDGRATRVVGDPDAPLYGGYTCPKGRALPEIHANPARLLQSQARGPDGSHAPIGSDQALDEVAARVGEILAEHGPRAVAMYVGTNALPYPASPALANAWHRAIGSRMFFTSNTIDQPGKQVAAALHGGWVAGAQSFSTARTWLIVGQNPLISKSASVPSQDPGRKLADAIRRGLRLVVIDPRRSETARRAHVHLQPRPGEDPTLLAAMLHVILEEGLADDAFLRDEAEGVDALRAAVAPFTADYAAARAGVPRDDLVEAARVFAGAGRGGASCGTGPSFAGRGNLTEYLALVLCTVCGYWPRAGEPATRLNVLLPPFEPRAQPYAPSRAWGFGEKMRVRGLTNTTAGLPTAALADEILMDGAGQVKALFVLGGNPMMAWPDQRKAQAALEKLDLLVTLDVEMSATAQLADYVIASPMTLETPGMSQAVELLKYFGPAVGYPEPFAQYHPKIVDPPEGADLIEEWAFFYGLAQRMGLDVQLVGFYGWGRHIESPPIVTALDMQRTPTTDELDELMTQGSRIPLEEVKRYPHGHVFGEVDAPVAPRDPACTDRLEVGDATMLRELAEIWGEDATRRHEVPGFPFRLVPRRSNDFVNSSGRSVEKLTHGRPYNPAFLHTDDLSALGIESGVRVRIRSRHDAVQAIVAADDGLRRGVVSMTHAFGDLPSRDSDVARVGSNTGRLLRADDDFDPYTGIPRMGALPVAIEPISE